MAGALRAATPADAAAVAAIYAHHVAHGTASYDTSAPDESLWRDKIASVAARGWPFLVAVADEGEVAGYAYATQMRDRAGYAFTCEDSIYVHHAAQRRGIGRRLLEALIAEASAGGFRQMIAVIGGAEPASIALHAACGFREAGRLKRVGFKFGRWLDSVYMQRALGGDDTAPAEA